MAAVTSTVGKAVANTTAKEVSTVEKVVVNTAVVAVSIVKKVAANTSELLVAPRERPKELEQIHTGRPAVDRFGRVVGYLNEIQRQSWHSSIV